MDPFSSFSIPANSQVSGNESKEIQRNQTLMAAAFQEAKKSPLAQSAVNEQLKNHPSKSSAQLQKAIAAPPRPERKPTLTPGPSSKPSHSAAPLPITTRLVQRLPSNISARDEIKKTKNTVQILSSEGFNPKTTSEYINLERKLNINLESIKTKLDTQLKQRNSSTPLSSKDLEKLEKKIKSLEKKISTTEKKNKETLENKEKEIREKLDSIYDGSLMGIDVNAERETMGFLDQNGERGGAYHASENYDEIPPVIPRGMSRAEAEKLPKALFINGIMTTAQAQVRAMQALANGRKADATHEGMQLFGIHNATEGLIKDLLECGKGKAGKHVTPEKTAVEVFLQHFELREKENLEDFNRPFFIMAHSQGAIITSSALFSLEKELTIKCKKHLQSKHGDQVTKKDVQNLTEKLMGNIYVQTCGGAGTYWPKGPGYLHWVNTEDKIATKIGVNARLKCPPCEQY